MADLSDRWTQIQTLFDQALDRPADERTAWLRAACGDDPALYAEVAAMLDGAENESTLFGGLAADLVPDALGDALADARAAEAGARVGPWVLGERIGAGGMGTVYRAERADGFEQTAALKRVKPGMDSHAVLARFRHERQVLACLEHPGIARLLDGGLDADGRPYFAMELVDGEPITDYADARRLDLDARLALFEGVCEAVAYAHRALVVHRDLKPSNVLVADGEPGSTPQVKLLDFGIARVLSDGDAELTQTGQRVFTPGYAAPEQVRGEPPTTQTDVYALGVLLYRLVAGARPIETEGRTPAEIERAVLDETPPRPSTAVTDAAATARGTTDAALTRALRGDLDTVCLTAVRKEPGRRYGSAAELLADVRRFRQGFPIEARPTTRAYRARKFVERNRTAVLGTVAALVALVALTAFYTARLATERDRARLEADKASEVSAFLRSVFEGADPSVAEGDTVTARALLDRGAARVETELAGEPAVQAQMMSVVGDVYLSLGLADDAAGMFERALAVRRSAFGARDTSAASSLVNLADARIAQGAFPQADSLFQEALAIYGERLPAGASPMLDAYSGMARARHSQGLRADAESLFVLVLDGRRADPATTPRQLSRALHNLGKIRLMSDDRDRAAEHIREALAVYRASPDPDMLAATGMMNDLALVADVDAGEALYREVLTTRQRYLGDDHRDVAQALNNLGAFLREKRPDDAEAQREAETISRQAVEVFGRTIGEDQMDYAAALNNLGTSIMNRGGYTEALPILERAAAIAERATGPAHWAPSAMRLNVGKVQTRLGRYAEAERVLLAALEGLRAGLGDASDPVQKARDRVAELYEAWDRPDQAARYRSG